MAGPYIKPTIFSGDWVNFKYDETPINYFMMLSGTPSSISESKIVYPTSSFDKNTFNTPYYFFNRKRLFLENSEGLLPGPINESRRNLLNNSRFSSSAMDIMYNSTFYELLSSSSVVKVEIPKRIPHIFSFQFSSINNSRYIPLIIRPFGASFGYNAKIWENINTPFNNNKNNINAVTGVHFHNPTYDSYLAYKTPYLLPEDREVGLGVPMYSKFYITSPSSMIFIGAIRPFDFVAASGEHQGNYDSEKGTGSFANPVFWRSWIMAQDYNFNWSGIEGVHKIKQYFYNHKDLVVDVSAGQHRVMNGIDLYMTNTFNKGYLYRPDMVGQDALYDLDTYKYWPSVTSTNTLFGPVQDRVYSGLFCSGPVFDVNYICCSGVENAQAPYVIDQRQGLWHTVYHYDFNTDGNIFADAGKSVLAASHPYASSVFGGDANAYFASGQWDGWNADPAFPFTSDVRYGPKSGQGKPYVCPIFELTANNPFNTSDRVCVGIYTKLTPSPESSTRPNSISIGNRREQIVALWKKDVFYRPTKQNLETTSSYFGTLGPYSYEDINAGGYCKIYSSSNQRFTKGWKMLEYWFIVAENKEQVISKINYLHQRGVAEPGPMAPELELPQAVLNSVLDNPIRGTL